MQINKETEMKDQKLILLKRLINLENQIKDADPNPKYFSLWRQNFNLKQQKIFENFCRVFNEMYDDSCFMGHFLSTSKMLYTCHKGDYESKFQCPVCKKQSNVYESYEDCEHCTSPLEHFHDGRGGRVTEVRLNELKKRLGSKVIHRNL